MSLTLGRIVGSGFAGTTLLVVNSFLSPAAVESAPADDRVAQVIVDCDGPAESGPVSELSLDLVAAQVRAPRPVIVPDPVPMPEPTVAQAPDDENANPAVLADEDASNDDDGYCELDGMANAYPQPMPNPLGPGVCVFKNRKRANGNYAAFISYDGVNADVDLELQSASPDLLFELEGPLPEMIVDVTPVLIAQLVASDGENDLPLGLQADLGAGIKNGSRLRFPLYSRVGNVLKASPVANTIEARIADPYTGLPRSFDANKVTMYFWIQFGHQRYPVAKPLVIDLLSD